MPNPTVEDTETDQAAPTTNTNNKQSPSSGPHIANILQKQPTTTTAPSESPSIPSDIVDAGRMVKPTSRRHNLPPLPDLRFEQSYLASLKGADTWGRIAWITARDQV